jgi:hypothetical protein
LPDYIWNTPGWGYHLAGLLGYLCIGWVDPHQGRNNHIPPYGGLYHPNEAVRTCHNGRQDDCQNGRNRARPAKMAANSKCCAK